jgi:hypothetical protein
MDRPVQIEQSDEYITLNLYFTRHGYACSNLLSNSTGAAEKSVSINTRTPNSPLTDIGIFRSFNVGKLLLEHNCIPQNFAIISSPVSRAIMTAYYQYLIHTERDLPMKTINIFPHINEIENYADTAKRLSSYVYSEIDPYESSTSGYKDDLNKFLRRDPTKPSIYDYMLNNYNIDNRKIRIDPDYIDLLNECQSFPDPELFLKGLLINFAKYSTDAIDSDPAKPFTYNFVITSHGEYIKLFNNYLTGKNLDHHPMNNQVFLFKINIKKSLFNFGTNYVSLSNQNICLSTNFKSYLHNPSLEIITDFNPKPQIDIEYLASINLFKSCCDWTNEVSRLNGKTDQSYSKTNCAKPLNPNIELKYHNQDKSNKEVLDELSKLLHVQILKDDSLFQIIPGSASIVKKVGSVFNTGLSYIAPSSVSQGYSETQLDTSRYKLNLMNFLYSPGRFIRTDESSLVNEVPSIDIFAMRGGSKPNQTHKYKLVKKKNH